MEYEISLQKIQPQEVIVIRDKIARAELEQALATLLPRVSAYLKEKGVAVSGQPFVRYHTPQAVDRIGHDVEVGYPVAHGEEEEGEGNIIAGRLPGGQVAVTRHEGSYAGIAAAYEALGHWIEQNEYESAGTPWEVYVTDPAAMDETDVWRVDLFWPIAHND